MGGASGLLPLEAMASGTPPVAAATGGGREYLARALGDGLALGRDPAAASRNRAAEFDLERALDIAEQVYARAVGPRA